VFSPQDWSDCDVWDFIEALTCPSKRTDMSIGLELPDKKMNNDYIPPAPTVSIPVNQEKYSAPLVGHDIDSVAHLVLTGPAALPDYIK